MSDSDSDSDSDIEESDLQYFQNHKNLQGARLLLLCFLLEKDWDEKGPDATDFDFEDLVVMFVTWAFLDKTYTLALTTIKNHLQFYIEVAKRRFPAAAEKKGYSKLLDRKAASHKFEKFQGYQLFMTIVSQSFGDPRNAINGPKRPLFTADIRDYLLLTTGIGSYGLRTLAFLYAFMEADWGPRGGTWWKLTDSDWEQNREGRVKLFLRPNKVTNGNSLRRELLLSQEASEVFMHYIDTRHLGIVAEANANLFFPSREALSKAIKDCGRRAGFGVDYFTSHSGRVGKYVEALLFNLLDKGLSYKQANERAIEKIGWKARKTSEKYDFLEVIQFVQEFKEQGKRLQDLGVLDRHPALLKKPEPRRVARLCSNDGFPKALRQLVACMKKEIDRNYTPPKNWYDESGKGHSQEYNKLLGDIAEWLFKQDALDGSVRRASAAIEDNKARGPKNKKSSKAKKDAKTNVVNILIRHRALELCHIKNPDEVHKVKVSPRVLATLSLQPVPPAKKTDPEITQAGNARKRAYRKPNYMEGAEQYNEASKKPRRFYNISRDDANFSFVKSNVENRKIVPLAPTIPHHDLIEIYPLGTKVRQEFQSEAGNFILLGEVNSICFHYNETGTSYDVCYIISFLKNMKEGGEVPEDLSSKTLCHLKVRLLLYSKTYTKRKYVVQMNKRVMKMQFTGTFSKQMAFGKVRQCEYLRNQDFMTYTIDYDGVPEQVDERDLIENYSLYDLEY